MKRVEYHSPYQDGWNLDVRQFWDPRRLSPELHPVLLVPGYGMNTHVLGYHPGGPSLIDYLVDHGFEVWAANLRGQGNARRQGPERPIGFREVVLGDLARVLALVRDTSRVDATRIHGVGASLGATYLYVWLAHHPEDHGLASLTSLGGPLRWDRAHPLMRLAFASPALAGAVRLKGIRPLARAVLPVVKRFPWILGLYMNAGIVDLTAADELTETVNDPFPHMNRQIAHWLKTGQLVVGGVDVYAALAPVRLPILLVLANRDGIVPPEAVRSVRAIMPEAEVDELVVGDEETWYAHADLFVSHLAQEKVFAPLATWLQAR